MDNISALLRDNFNNSGVMPNEGLFDHCSSSRGSRASLKHLNYLKVFDLLEASLPKIFDTFLLLFWFSSYSAVFTSFRVLFPRADGRWIFKICFEARTFIVCRISTH